MIYVILQDAPQELVDAVGETLSPDQALVANSDKKIKRDMHHKLAIRGSVLFSDSEEDQESPMYVGKLEDAVGKAKNVVEYMEGRLSFFRNKLPANYVGRVFDDPKNIIIGDSGSLYLHKYTEILPNNWWGSLGFLTEYDPHKLFTILEMYLPNCTPIAVTQKAHDALSLSSIDFVDARAYPLNEKGGLQFREATSR